MVEESALLDLKHLLMEAQQRVPPVLMALEDPTADMDEVSDGANISLKVVSCPVPDVLAFSSSSQLRYRQHSSSLVQL